jgi:hypothetical protein
LTRDKNRDRGKRSQYKKEFYSIDFIGHPEITNNYGYFTDVEEMAALGLTGEEILADPGLRQRYVLELLGKPYRLH